MSIEKRPAFEPPAVLADPVVPQVTMRRPSATTFGALLVVLRVLAGVVWLTSLALQWDRILREDLQIEIDGASEAAAAQFVLTSILVFGGLVLAVDLGLAALVFLGNNAARVAVMIVASLSITLSAIDYFTGGEEITLRTTLVTLALDILVLLALSSRAARAYARRPRPKRR